MGNFLWQMPSQASRSLQLQDIAFIRSDYVQKPVSNSYGYCSLWLRSWIALIPVRSAQCTWFMVYRTRNITFDARLFWYMAYRKMNITCEARFFGTWLIERGILHLNRASCSLWLIERGMLHLKRACFGIWPIERGILHVKHAFVVYGL